MGAARATIAFFSIYSVLSASFFVTGADIGGSPSTTGNEPDAQYGVEAGVGDISTSGGVGTWTDTFYGLLQRSGAWLWSPPVPRPMIELSFRPSNEKCIVDVKGEAGVTMEDVRLTLDDVDRTITATYEKDEEEDEKNQQGGRRYMSRMVKSVSTVRLPMHCLATAALMRSYLSGYMVDWEALRTGGPYRAVVFIPSSTLHRKYTREGQLPPNIGTVLAEGKKEELERLTPRQQCLAVGFTAEECLKLGNARPGILKVAREVDGRSVPIPLYDYNLQFFEG